MAIGWYRTSIGTAADGVGANVHLLEDGSVIVYQGLVEMGQGMHTGIAQIAAEALGVALEDVRVVNPDTDSVPESGPTVGSRCLTLMGNAILLAAQQIKEPLMQSASELLETPAERLVARDRYIFDRDNPARRLEVKEAARRTMAMGRRMVGQAWYAPPKATLDPKTGQGSPYFVYSYATQMAEVEVDMATGEVTVKKIASAFDIGKAINPMLLEGQIDGGIGMGLGYGLMEKVVLDEGVIQNLGLKDYLIPTSLDMPEITAALIEKHNIHGPYGAKGIGEMPNIPTPAALNNAVANAIGARIYRGADRLGSRLEGAPGTEEITHRRRRNMPRFAANLTMLFGDCRLPGEVRAGLPRRVQGSGVYVSLSLRERAACRETPHPRPYPGAPEPSCRQLGGRGEGDRPHARQGR